MHSLKNTIVAVGLLGLSFVFYQMSGPDDSNFEELELPQVTELADGLAADKLPTADKLQLADKLKLPSLKSPLKPGNAMPLSSPAQVSSRPSQNLRSELPSPKINNPLAPIKPNLTAPILAPPKGSNATVPEFKPRPEAKFDFTGKSAQPSAQPNAQQRDQGLITALKSQPNGSNSFQPKAKVSAQSASFMRDPAVVAASKVESVEAPNQFKLNPATSGNNDPYANLSFQEALTAVDKLVAEQRFRKSLQVATRFYDDADLSGPQRQRLDAYLSGLATKVIYSNEPHLSPNYISKPGDSLLELGREWGIPGQLIYNINKNNLPNPLVIAPGTELKKIPGPINATISLSNDTLTLFVDGLYAGRFNVKVGTAGTPRQGDFKVVSKSPNGHDWADANGVYPPGDRNNHYGKNWIGLEGSLCLHAVDANTVDGHPGCIGLSEKDASDLFSILSEGSTISIR